VQAVDLARHAGKALREIVGIGRSTAIADGKKEVTTSVESHPASEVQTTAGRLIGRRIEDHFKIGEPVILQLSACNCGESAFADRLRVSDVDPAVLRVSGVQREIKESSLTPRDDRWNTGNFAWRGSRFVDERKPSATFGDKKPSIGQLRHGPRMVKTVGYGLDPEAVSGGVDHPGPCVGHGEEKDSHDDFHGWPMLTNPADPSKRKTARTLPSGGCGGVFAFQGAVATLGCS